MKNEEPVPATVSSVVCYQEQKEKADRLREARQQAKAASAEVQEEAAADAPMEDWPLYRYLRTLKAHDASNAIVEALSELSPEAFQQAVSEALRALAEDKEIRFPLKTNLVQLFSPQGAKGYARTKPDSTGRGDKTKDGWAVPFLEWLRVRGYFRIACPYAIGDDVRLLCPVPRNISFGMLKQVVTGFRANRSLAYFRSAPKLDVLASLAMAQTLIEYAATMGVYGEPEGYLAGLSIVHYQSMRQAHAITSVSEVALPGWFDLKTEAEKDLWLETLDEHTLVLRSLDDTISDEIGLLLQYRRYLETRGPRTLDRLLDFLEGYGIHVMRKRGQNDWRNRQFAIERLEAILRREMSYLEILQNPGFRAVAGALRSATVSAQSLKRNNRDHRDIRYDILPELRRKRSLPGTARFLEAISAFVDSYNAESARRLELNKQSGTKRIETADWEAFVRLFDGQKDAALIGSMLCAYATCREAAEPQDQPGDNNNE
jgi:hypothetical protein